jgi:CheY-like chemotaxis protein
MVEERVAPVRVLLADDNEILSGLLGTFLRGNGYEVEATGSGQEALNRLSGSNFDVLVTDLAMPGLGGADLIDLVRNAGVPLPVIVISGYVEGGEPRWLQELGANCTLPKPFDMEDLLSAVEQLTVPCHGGGR